MMVITVVRNSLDARIFYTGEESMAFFNALSSDDWHKYVRTEMMDLFFLTTYTSLSISFMKGLYPAKKILHGIAIIPGFFDLIETSTIILFLVKASDSTLKEWLSVFPSWMGYITCAKWMTGLVVVAILLFGLIKNKKAKQVFPLRFFCPIRR